MSAASGQRGVAARRSLIEQLALLVSLSLTIPAFYLVLGDYAPAYRHAGHALYALTAVLLAARLLYQLQARRRTRRRHGHAPEAEPGHAARRRPQVGIALDVLLALGALASAWPGAGAPAAEWMWRLGFSVLAFLRMASLVLHFVALHRLLQLLLLAVAALLGAGAGFYWLEPRVTTFADGLWLAFITGATVGYGDLVPSTPASRVLAGFIVVMGYALFSVLTARIAALLVGEDERRQWRELHADLRLLRGDIDALRAELRRRDAAGREME